MLQLLLCSDVHTFTDNIRLAIKKAGQVDAVLISGDVEAEKETGARKVILGKHLYILRDNKAYSIDGKRTE